MYLKLLFSLLGLAMTIDAMKSYENYKVYNVIPTSEEEVQILSDLRKDNYDFWTDTFSVGSNVRIMVSPSDDTEFLGYVQSVGLSAKIAISNVQELIDAQLIPAGSAFRNSLGSFSWETYHTLSEIHDWLDELEELYPDVVTTVTIGSSNEGRIIKGVIIDFKPNDRGDNPVIGMIEGGIHAREWISPATVTWIIKEFLTSDDPNVRAMAEGIVWHIFPVVNPDGYVYTFTNNRMWRKNRNTAYFVNCTSDSDLSNGIDLNRNFDYLWMTTGASADPCQQTYAGPSGASEPETMAISSYVQNLKPQGNMVYYLAFHSYSQMILIPYSHATGFGVLEANNYGNLYEIAIRGAEKLAEKHGIDYQVGTSAEILYEVSGSSFDWVKGAVDIPIVYLFELRDTGHYGFLLPTEQIVPNNEEIMACLLEMDRTTKLLGYYQYSGSAIVVSSFLTLILNVAFLILVQ